MIKIKYLKNLIYELIKNKVKNKIKIKLKKLIIYYKKLYIDCGY